MGNTPIFQGGNTSCPLAQGWLGGDGGYTIPLTATSSLWLFGDTLSANNQGDGRDNSHFVHNTVALQTCHNATTLTGCNITYHWSDSDRTQPFWLTGHENDAEPQYYWPLDGFINTHDNNLYVFLQRTQSVPYGLNFEVLGGDVVIVSNWQADPSQWVKHYQTITNTNVSVVGQTAIANQGPGGNPNPADFYGPQYLYTHAYLTPLDGGSTVNALLRFPLLSMANMSWATYRYQYFSTSSSWQTWANPAVVPSDAYSFFDGQEIGTVRYNARFGQWLNVSPAPNRFFGGGAVWSGSTSLLSGWTSQAALYQYPETQQGSAVYNSDAWCYASLEHVEWEPSTNLTFTYACNGHSLNTVYSDDQLYTPQLVRIAYPTIN